MKKIVDLKYRWIAIRVINRHLWCINKGKVHMQSIHACHFSLLILQIWQSMKRIAIHLLIHESANCKLLNNPKLTNKLDGIDSFGFANLAHGGRKCTWMYFLPPFLGKVFPFANCQSFPSQILSFRRQIPTLHLLN